MSQFFASGGQSIGVSGSTSVLPMNTQDCSPLGWSDWISLLSKGLSRVFSNTTLQKHQFFGAQLSSQSNSQTTGKTIAVTRQTFVGKVMSVLLNMLSRLVITFLPRSKHLLISWLQLGQKFTAGEGHGNPLQYCCLKNPMDGGAWQAIVHGVAKSRT